MENETLEDQLVMKHAMSFSNTGRGDSPHNLIMTVFNYSQTAILPLSSQTEFSNAKFTGFI